jgi:hypothetical protein
MTKDARRVAKKANRKKQQRLARHGRTARVPFALALATMPIAVPMATASSAFAAQPIKRPATTTTTTTTTPTTPTTPAANKRYTPAKTRVSPPAPAPAAAPAAAPLPRVPTVTPPLGNVSPISSIPALIPAVVPVGRPTPVTPAPTPSVLIPRPAGSPSPVGGGSVPAGTIRTHQSTRTHLPTPPNRPVPPPMAR